MELAILAIVLPVGFKQPVHRGLHLRAKTVLILLFWLYLLDKPPLWGAYLGTVPFLDHFDEWLELVQFLVCQGALFHLDEVVDSGDKEIFKGGDLIQDIVQ